MSGLKGSLIELMADISKVKADEKVLADVEKKELSADYDNICRKCDELKHVFPIGFEVRRWNGDLASRQDFDCLSRTSLPV